MRCRKFCRGHSLAWLIAELGSRSSIVVDYRTMYRTVYHTTLGRFSMIDISTAVGILSVPKRKALGTSRRELSERVSFGIGTLLVVEQSGFENRTRGE